MVTQYRFIVLIASLLAACSPPAATSDSPQAEVHDLIQQTLDNLVFVEGGSFMMGDVGTYITRESYSDLGNFEYVDADHPEAMFLHWTTGPHHEDNKPAHKVSLSNYSLARHETTYGEYDVFTKATGRPLIEKDLAGDELRGPKQPVPVNWHQARAYCLWMGEQTGLPFDLPTEAQWEFAARSRGQNVFMATDDGGLDVGRNYPSFKRGPWAVASFPPNPLGLYDMSGNVSEWVYDWYDPDYYNQGPKIDPKGPETGEKKIFRGGWYANSPTGNNVFARVEKAPDTDDIGFGAGFRCAVWHREPIRVEDLSVLNQKAED